MQCPRCNSQLSGKERFCANCGLNLMEWYNGKEREDQENIEDDIPEQDANNCAGQDEENNSEQETEESEENTEKLEEIQEEESEDKMSDSYVDPYGGMDKNYSYDPYKDMNSSTYDPYKDIRQPEPEKTEETVSENATQKTEVSSDSSQQQNRKVENHSDLHQEAPRKSHKSHTILICLIAGIVLGVAGAVLISNMTMSKSNKDTQVVMETLTPEPENETPEPAEAAETPEPTATPEPTPTPELSWQAAVSKQEQEELQSDGTWLDKNYMKSLMDVSNSRYGLYVMDLTDYVDYEIGEAETPLPASALIGIPIMYTVAEGVSSGAYNMSDLVTFSYTYANGRGGYKEGQNGQLVSIGDLLKVGLMYSDNNAWNSLMDYLTYDRINTVCHQYGYESVSLQKKIGEVTTDRENYISPKDAAMMLNAIYQDNFTGIDSSFLRNYYWISPSDTANRGMYPACANAGTFLNLNGITDTRYNEVGLVENGDEVFIMSVFTTDGRNESTTPCVGNEAAYILANLKAGEK